MTQKETSKPFRERFQQTKDRLKLLLLPKCKEAECGVRVNSLWGIDQRVNFLYYGTTENKYTLLAVLETVEGEIIASGLGFGGPFSPIPITKVWCASHAPPAEKVFSSYGISQFAELLPDQEEYRSTLLSLY